MDNWTLINTPLNIFLLARNYEVWYADFWSQGRHQLSYISKETTLLTYSLFVVASEQMLVNYQNNKALI